MLICLNVLLIFMIGSLSIVSSLFVDGMCDVALAPATNTISGATFHPLVMTLLMSGWYFVVFLLRVFVVNPSLQYLNSINYMVNSGSGVSGGGWLYSWPMTHSMSGCLHISIITLHSIMNTIGRTNVSSQDINKHTLLITTTKSWEVGFSIRLLHAFHRRFANATHVLLCKATR